MTRMTRHDTAHSEGAFCLALVALQSLHTEAAIGPGDICCLWHNAGMRIQQRDDQNEQDFVTRKCIGVPRILYKGCEIA